MTALIVVGIILAWTSGVLFGATFAVRNAHRIIARLDPPERLAFARKVNLLARHR